MELRFTLALALASAALAGCSSAAVSSGGAPADKAPVGNHAYDTLHDATQIEGARVGYEGVPSSYAAAFREILDGPDARRAFGALVREGSTAGRLYGLMGLYFVDGAAFRTEAARLATSDAPVSEQSGCVVFPATVREVVSSSKPDRLRVPRGKRLRDVVGSTDGTCDIGGGCLPLSLFEDDRAAPTDPL